MIAPIVVAAIVAAITAIANAIGGAVNAAPTKGDRYRKARIKQLGTLAEEGFTSEQEEALRSIGLGAAATSEREARSRRGDALALLDGGATARDILAAEAMDTARAKDTRLQVENEVKRADIRERDLRRRELQELTAQQEASQKQKRAAVTQAITGVASDAATIVSAGATSASEEGAAAVEEAAKRQTGFGATSYGDTGKSSNGLYGQYTSQGFDPQTAATLANLTPEQRQELLMLLGGN